MSDAPPPESLRDAAAGPIEEHAGQYEFYLDEPSEGLWASIEAMFARGPMPPDTADFYRSAFPDHHAYSALLGARPNGDERVLVTGNGDVIAPKIVTEVADAAAAETFSHAKKRAVEVWCSPLREAVLVGLDGGDIYLLARWTRNPGTFVSDELLKRWALAGACHKEFDFLSRHLGQIGTVLYVALLLEHVSRYSMPGMAGLLLITLGVAFALPWSLPYSVALAAARIAGSLMRRIEQAVTYLNSR